MQSQIMALEFTKHITTTPSAFTDLTLPSPRR
jgi:hypothetical protein